MPKYAYERIKLSDNKYRLRRQKATSFAHGCKKAFVQLYTLSGAYIEANPYKNKELKDFYFDEDIEGLYLVEPCPFIVENNGKSYFKRGKMSGEGTTRYYMPGFSVPKLMKRSLKEFAYAIAEERVSREIEMKLIHDIDRLEDDVGKHIPSLVEGAVGYVDKYVIPINNKFRTPTLIETLKDKLESLVLDTRFNV